MKEKASALAFAILILIVFLMLKSKPRPSDPEECIRAMLDCAARGDIAGYLDCFDDELRANLQNKLERMGADKFARYLRERNKPVKGVAFSDVERTRKDELRMRVEWVFLDRNEVQRFTLKKVGGRWKIKDMSEPRYVKPLVPYGTKVFEE